MHVHTFRLFFPCLSFIFGTRYHPVDILLVRLPNCHVPVHVVVRLQKQSQVKRDLVRL